MLEVLFALSFCNLTVRLFVKAKDNLRAANEQRSPNQIGFLGHQPDGFRAGRRMLLQVAFAEEFVSRIQKLLVISIADELIEFGLAEELFIQIARIKLNFFLEQETSCFAACASGWFLIEDNLRGHEFLRLFSIEIAQHNQSRAGQESLQ
jgi:hypothetical protein